MTAHELLEAYNALVLTIIIVAMISDMVKG
jgi:hypothetical protein